MNMIEIKNLSKYYGDNKVIDDITLNIKKGEIFGLLGPNGAGKSTLISIITTIQKPDGGQLFIEGKNIEKNNSYVKKLIGFVPQDIALYEGLSARENLEFFGKLYNLKGKHLKERIEYIVELTGLNGKSKDAVASYSGGMKRRLNIGVALLHNPEILIMDEPTVGIDPQSRNHILDNVLEFNKLGMTVIYTSHYIEEVEYICDRIGIIDRGRLLALGSKQELIKAIGDEKNIRIKVQNMNQGTIDLVKKINGIIDVTERNEGWFNIGVHSAEATISNILSVLENNNISIDGMEIKDINLESVFLNLTGKELRD
jgi:ABC-2 type transport system ATP-binding protein